MSELYAFADAGLRQRLAASPMGGLRPGEKVVDLFCGAGGWGEGAKRLGVRVDYAVNHWPVAIDTHTVNNPGCEHHCGDAWKARPRGVVGKAKVGLLLASAACTTHSRARGSAPVSKRVHMLGWCIARWMKEAQPRLVAIENVPEWKDWGPLIPKVDGRGKPVKDEQGRAVMVQDPARKGQHYRRFLRYVRTLGYTIEERIVDAPDYGEASRRRRLFLWARRDGLPICWPEKTHGKLEQFPRGADVAQDAGGVPGSSVGADESPRCSQVGKRQDRLQPRLDWTHPEAVEEDAGHQGRGTSRTWKACGVHGALAPYRSAAECIDWSDLGRSIFDRDKPLKPKTQARIAEGIRRYVIADPAPFVLRVTQGEGKGWHVHPSDLPLPTQTGRQDLALATPIMGRTCRHGGVSRADGPMQTQTTAQDHAVAVPVLAPQNSGVYGQRVDEPGPTITQKGHQSLITPVLTPAGGPKNQPHPVNEPMRTLLGRESFGIATPVLAGAGGSGYAGKPVRVDGPLNTVKCDDRRAVATPVLMNNTTGHTGGRVDEPGPTVTTGGQTGLVTPMVSYAHHGGGQHSDVRGPLNAIMSGGTHAGLVAPLTADYYGNSTTLHQVGKPLGAVTTLDRHASVNVVMTSMELALERGRRVAKWLREHLGEAVPIDQESGLAYTLIDGIRRFFVDILFRMLKPKELARAMGFPDDYVWPKTQRDTVRLIGNAVSVRTAMALLGAMLPRGRIGKRAGGRVAC